MKKFLLPLFCLLSYSPSHASWFDSAIESLQIGRGTSELQKCIGATTLLLGTLSGLGDVKDKDSVNLGLQVLGEMKKDLENEQAAQDLHSAIESKNYNLAINLLRSVPSLDINARFSSNKRTALMQCCLKGDESIDVVKDILKHPKLDITIKNKYGKTCLYYACLYGRLKITSFLLKREDIGKILHVKTNNGSTPLDCIIDQVKWSRAKIGHMSVWNMLVTKGAQLSGYKKEYKQLNSDDFKPPYSDYIDIIKSNPPREINVFKKSFLGRNMNSNQQGRIEDIEGYQHEGERKEEE